MDYLQGGHHEKFDAFEGLVRNCSGVLAELWRGATQVSKRRFLTQLEKRHPVWTPTSRNGLESGLLLAELRRKHGIGSEKLRDLHFDVLIALTARSHGARVITSNRKDFEMIIPVSNCKVEIW